MNGPQPNNEDDDGGEHWSYDPREGFILSQASLLEHHGLFECHAKKLPGNSLPDAGQDEPTQMLSFYVNVLRKSQGGGKMIHLMTFFFFFCFFLYTILSLFFNSFNNYNFLMKQTDVTGPVPKPHINHTLADQAALNGNFQLNCSAAFDLGVGIANLEWTVPNGDGIDVSSSIAYSPSSAKNTFSSSTGPAH